MILYPVRRSWTPAFRYCAAILSVLAISLAVYWTLLQPRSSDWWLVVLGMGGMALLLLLVGLAAYWWRGSRHAPRVGSTLLAGYGVALFLACLTTGGLAGVLFLDNYDRILLWVLLLFVAGIGLAVGYLHAHMLSSRLEALLGAADALSRGQYHARVEIEGKDQLAALGATLNTLAARLQAVEQEEHHFQRVRQDLQSWIGADMRIPLGRALATVDAVAAGAVDDPATYLRFLHSAQRNVHLLSDLVDDLFDIMRTDANGLAADCQWTAAQTLIAETVEAMGQAARDRGVTLSGAPTQGLPPIQVDAHQIRRVLINLVTHALHRTPAGGVVKVNAYPTRAGVLFEVLDYYEGERPEEAVELLRLFLDEGDARRHTQSAPLGLAMADMIVQAHGGSIRSERIGGSKGLRLVFSLAREESAVSQGPRGM